MNLPLSSKPSHRRSVTERSAQNGPFARLHLSKNVCTALQKVMGFRLPTPIQRCAIPPILEGKDVVAMARTGSGKTVAFLAPLMDLLIDHSSAVGIRAIIVSPTRELAVQTASVTKKLMKLTNLKLAVLMGGAAMQGQFERLSLNPDIVLATPGRLIHHLVEAELSLKAVQIVIVDEADRLFELGFSEQLQTLWAALPPTRQCVLISATLPAKLVSFSRIGLKEPVFVRLDIEQSLSPTLDLQFLYIRETDKVAALFRVAKKTMQEERKALVFVATRHHVEFCSRALQRLGGRVSLVYGKMDQECRLQQLSTYRKGESDFLVVTDVAARGLDMPLVDTIINYDFPSSSKLFIHRAGRTARNGKSGTAISFVTQADLPYTVELLLFLDRKLVLSTDTQISIVADDEIVNADSSETKDIPSSTLSSISTPSSTFAQIGALPELHVEIEYFYKLLEQDCEFESLYKSMLAAYKLYYKTRLPASSRSKDRAKVLLDSCGGASRLSEMVHPAFKMQGYNLHETVMGDDTSLNLIDEMRSFRPSVGRKNGALSTSVASQMARQKFLSKETTRPMHFSITPNGPDSTTLEPRIDFFSNGLPDSLYPENSFKVSSHEDLLSEAKGIEGTHTTFVRNEKSSETPSEGFCKTGASSSSDSPPVVLASGKLEFQSASAVTYHPSSLKVRQRGPRISKRRQRRQGEGATTLSSHCIATSTASNPQFFLNARISEKGLLRDDVLSIQNAQMDVTPDEESDLKRSKHVQKWNWNPKKKKYEKGILDASGKIMKDHKGKKIRGQVEKKGIYKKWMATSKRRIQRVGEKEDTTNIPRAEKGFSPLSMECLLSPQPKKFTSESAFDFPKKDEEFMNSSKKSQNVVNASILSPSRLEFSQGDNQKDEDTTVSYLPTEASTHTYEKKTLQMPLVTSPMEFGCSTEKVGMDPLESILFISYDGSLPDSMDELSKKRAKRIYQQLQENVLQNTFNFAARMIAREDSHTAINSTAAPADSTLVSTTVFTEKKVTPLGVTMETESDTSNAMQAASSRLPLSVREQYSEKASLHTLKKPLKREKRKQKQDANAQPLDEHTLSSSAVLNASSPQITSSSPLYSQVSWAGAMEADKKARKSSPISSSPASTLSMQAENVAMAEWMPAFLQPKDNMLTPYGMNTKYGAHSTTEKRFKKSKMKPFKKGNKPSYGKS